MTKKCEHCNKVLTQRENEFDVHFQARRFCNRSCATKYQWNKKKK